MELPPEERRKIYEEEKARIAAEQRQRVTGGRSTTGLEPNVAGLLCYLGFWVTGIVFLVIEQQNRFVRFHALQSIVTFGALTIVSALVGWIPYVGIIFGPMIGVLVLILWIIMMVKAHQGEIYRLPLAGQVAEEMLPVEWRTGRPGTGPEQGAGETAGATGSTDVPEGREARSEPVSQNESRAANGGARDNAGIATRGRLAGYGIATAFNVILLVFFSFFHGYIAYYTNVAGVIIRFPLLTDAYFTFLPMLVTALVITIAAYILLIAYDRYWLREVVQIVLAAIGVAVLVNLIAIFPFDFSVIPDAHVASILPTVVTIALIVVAVALGISALVRFIRLTIGITR